MEHGRQLGATAGAATAENLIQEGVLNGYQTMDVIAALIFSIIVVQTVKGFGAASRASMAKSVGLACGVSALMLFAVYGGLAYLGALAALLVSLCSVLAGSFGVEALAFVDLLPLGNLGFAWLLPTLVAAALGALVDYARTR